MTEIQVTVDSETMLMFCIVSPLIIIIIIIIIN